VEHDNDFTAVLTILVLMKKTLETTTNAIWNTESDNLDIRTFRSVSTSRQ